MSGKLALVLFLTFFVALAASFPPTTFPPPIIEDITGDELNNERVTRVIQLAKARLVADHGACNDDMHVEGVQRQTNPGPLYMVKIHVQPCAGTASPAETICQVDVLDITTTHVHKVHCPAPSSGPAPAHSH